MTKVYCGDADTKQKYKSSIKYALLKVILKIQHPL